MRIVQPELQARLDSGATTLCRCWKVRRRDGVDLGFTDHDTSLKFGGVTFEAETGLDASALQSATGLSVDNGQARGALSSAAINEGDIRAGLFDGAEIWQWLVDWQRPDLRVLMFRGNLGEIRRADGAFEVELRGLAERLNVPVGRSVLRTCDRVLGDARCRVDTSLAAYSATVVARAGSAGIRIVCEGLGSFAPQWFAQGTVQWLDGANIGRTQSIRSDSSATGERILELWQEPGRPLQTGDRLKVVAGCDKRAETCREKFVNLLNFRGFPHIPGEDWVTAYPKEGFVHDGSSRQQ